MKIVAPGTVEPALPWFKHHYGRDLPPNEEGIERDLYLETTRFWPWSIAERIKLKQEVVTFNQRKVAMEQALDMGNEGEGGDEDGVDLAERLKEIDENWYVENTEGIDWDSIALVVSLPSLWLRFSSLTSSLVELLTIADQTKNADGLQAPMVATRPSSPQFQEVLERRNGSIDRHGRRERDERLGRDCERARSELSPFIFQSR